MAIVEEVSDDETPVFQSPHAESSAAKPARQARPAEAPPEPINMSPVNQAELLATLRVLSSRLALPPGLLPKFMGEDKDDRAIKAYHDRAAVAMRDIANVLKGDKGAEIWGQLSIEEQGELWSVLGRTRGKEAWTNVEMQEALSDIPMDQPEQISLHILQHTLRPLFAPHPSLSAANRALSRPTGGEAAMSDMHDDSAQDFKSAAGWGSHNLLAFCASNLSPSVLLDKIGLVLPPTLVLMDDWESAWRLRGIRVLESWVDKVDAQTMNRMGLGKLLVGSLIHTLSMHGSHEVPDTQSLVVQTTMKLIWRLWDGQERMAKVEEVMEKGVIHGWVYSPSGAEGRVVGIKIARDLQVVIEYIREGIVRWLKTIIPSLLQPLAFSPTPHSAAHLDANLMALQAVLVAVAPTGRAQRWRGLIMDYTARLWVELVEREKEDGLFTESTGSIAPASWATDLKIRVSDVVSELSQQCPTIKSTELAELLTIDRSTFAALVA